jgi:hypothetical protein
MKRTCLVFAPLLLLLSGFGCSKVSSQYTTATPMTEAAELPPAPVVDITRADASYDYRNAEYDFSDDVIDGEFVAVEAKVFANRARRSVGTAREAAPARSERGAPSTAKQPPTDPDETSKGEPAVGKDDTPDHGRQIIYVAGLQISVYNLEGAMAAVEALPERFGGWVHMRNMSQVVLRLPAAKLKPAMAELATLGVVEARTLQAQDVTAEYVDLDSRIKVLRQTQTQLLELLEKAKTVEEALHVRRALDQVTMELEVALGRMRQLSDLIAYSTLTVTLVERGPQDSIPTSNDPFGWVDTLGVEATEWR